MGGLISRGSAGTPSGPKTTAELWALIAQLDQQIDQASVERAAAAAAVQKLTGSGPPAVSAQQTAMI